MKEWNNDKELVRLIRTELYTAVIGDIMDKMGYRNQFLPPRLRPLAPGMTIVGRAMTVQEADVAPMEADGEGDKAFGLMLDALDDLRPGEVYLCSGASPSYALWGELMSTRAMMCGAAGAVVNGYSRDTRGIVGMGFPCFSYGPYAQDQAPRGRVTAWRVTLRVGAVTVGDGDMVIADTDGVCTVPRAIEGEVFARALEKARGEKVVMQAIKGGMTAKAAFAKYGIM